MMTQKNKELLLKDLCGRLPYGVKVRYSSYNKFITCTLHSINPVYNHVDLWSKDACFNVVDINKIKPYLFPLSSMTEEQECQYRKVIASSRNIYEVQDWLNANYFDYRDFIPMGLAIDATGLDIY